MKILQLMDYPLDGLDEHLSKIPLHNLFGYATLQEKGVEVAWFCERNNKILKYVSKFLGPEIFKIYLQLVCIFKSRKYDLIYSAHDIHIFILAFARMIGLCRTPILMLCHFSYNMNYVSSRKSRLFKIVERWLVFKGVDRVVFANEKIMQVAMLDFKVPLNHQNFVNWGADLSFFDSFINTPSIDDSKGDSYFLAAGTANRDYVTLVSAFAKTDYRLKVFGRLGESLEIADKNTKIEFYDLSKDGYKGMSILQDYYKNSIAILLPIYKINDVPNGATVLVEALAVGKPIVITDLDTNYIDVEAEGVGIKVKLGDIDGWKTAIEFLSKNPLICEEMGRKSRILAKQKYNYEYFLNNILYHIKDITKH